jgi:hypothetical protein
VEKLYAWFRSSKWVLINNTITEEVINNNSTLNALMGYRWHGYLRVRILVIREFVQKVYLRFILYFESWLHCLLLIIPHSLNVFLKIDLADCGHKYVSRWALKIVVGARELLTGNRKRVLTDFTFLHIPLNFSVHLLKSIFKYLLLGY